MTADHPYKSNVCRYETLCASFFTQIRSGKRACTGPSHMTHPGHFIYILKTVKINQPSLCNRDMYVDHQMGM